MLTISVQLVVDVQILCFENRWNIFELDALPEWLRGQTRNLMGSSRAGSNPAGIVFFYFSAPERRGYRSCAYDEKR